MLIQRTAFTVLLVFAAACYQSDYRTTDDLAAEYAADLTANGVPATVLSCVDRIDASDSCTLLISHVPTEAEVSGCISSARHVMRIDCSSGRGCYPMGLPVQP